MELVFDTEALSTYPTEYCNEIHVSTKEWYFDPVELRPKLST